jgi:LCP family protein required for cell wall assembly
MRDAMAGGNGYGTAPESGNVDWEQGPYRDDARSYAPQEPEVPEPRRPEPGAHRAGGGGPGSGHRKGGRRGQKNRKRRILQWVAIATAAGVLGTAGAAYGYYEYLSGKIRKGERSSGQTTVAKTKANSAGQTAMNILILGSDTRNNTDDAKLGGAADSVGARADVIMIAHLSADRTNMSVVSIPRDTRVDIPSCTDPKTHHEYPATNDIINASLGRGGPGCTLATVQNLTGVYIDHWLMIDFAGVVKMADVLGGVQVCVQHSVWDRPTKDIPHGGSGLKLTAGTHVIKGKQALQWLRTRDAFGSDAGRAQAQHMYMSSLIRTLRSKNYFGNPTELNKIATTAMSAFEVSSEIGTPKKLYDLGMQLKTIPPDRITMLTMPFIADQQDPTAHYLPDPTAAGTVWSLLRNDIPMDSHGKAKAPATGTPGAAPAVPTTPATAPAGPPAAAPASVPVTVVNGTAGDSSGVATSGRASSIRTTLTAAGFTQATASRQQDPSKGTTLVYPSSSGAQGRANATSVAKVLKIPAANVKASPDVQTITLTIGADWTSGTDFSATLPKAGAVPTSAHATNGADTTGCMPVEPIYRWDG